MAKGGGAGKVYFVLYLAVVLELLIIIVERDEAEQLLLKKQRETMRIVESILSQLQAGAGTEGINTRPQDEITIPPPGANIKEVMGTDIKPFRKYIVEVGVTDVSGELARKEGESEKDYSNRVKKYIQLGNVQELEYQIFFNSSPDPNNAPLFPSDEEMKKAGYEFAKMQPGTSISSKDGSSWEFMALRKLTLDHDATFNRISDFKKDVTPEFLEPIYPKDNELLIGTSFAPPGKDDSAFYYSYAKTQEQFKGAALANLKKRSFEVNFQPPPKAGWYKLRFASRTNRILGVRADANPKAIPEDATINIGTVTLTVRDLQKVNKELTIKLEKYGVPTWDDLANRAMNVLQFDDKLEQAKIKAAGEEKRTEIQSKIDLYGYICKLLAPGQSVSFPQNSGSIEFNIHVITPKPQIAKPEIVLESSDLNVFDKVNLVFPVTISPFQGKGVNQLDGKVTDESGAPAARVTFQAEDEIAGSTVTMVAGGGGKRAYRAIVDKELPPGKYKVELTHRLSGNVKTEVADLRVWKTGLTESSERKINNDLDYVYFANKFLQLTAEPSSGNKIPSRQFRIYLTTDQESQRPPVEGLSVASDNAIWLSCKARTATLKITWVQPLTGQEIDIFPSKTVDITQKYPRINPADQSPNVTPISANKMRVSIRNIKIAPANDGMEQSSFAEIKASVGAKVNFQGGLSGSELTSEPTIEKEGDNYTVSFDFTFNVARGTDILQGIASVSVKAQSYNKCNGKSSRPDEKTVNVNINKELQGGGGSRRGTGGGGGSTRTKTR